jgi:hypothetical protein
MRGLRAFAQEIAANIQQQAFVRRLTISCGANIREKRQFSINFFQIRIARCSWATLCWLAANTMFMHLLS